MFNWFHWHREGMLRLRPSLSVPVGDRCADGLVRPGCSSTLQHIRLFVRIYRDYSIADFAFVTLATLGVSYTTFSQPYVRSSVCEELSRHPELMRDMGEMGLSLENCEQWFERAVVAVLGIMFILIVVRVSLRYIRHSQFLAAATPVFYLCVILSPSPLEGNCPCHHLSHFIFR